MNTDEAGPLSTTGGQSVCGRKRFNMALLPEHPDGDIDWEHCEDSHHRSTITLMRTDSRQSNRTRR